MAALANEAAADQLRRRCAGLGVDILGGTDGVTEVAAGRVAGRDADPKSIKLDQPITLAGGSQYILKLNPLSIFGKNSRSLIPQPST